MTPQSRSSLTAVLSFSLVGSGISALAMLPQNAVAIAKLGSLAIVAVCVAFLGHSLAETLLRPW